METDDGKPLLAPPIPEGAQGTAKVIWTKLNPSRKHSYVPLDGPERGPEKAQGEDYIDACLTLSTFADMGMR